MDKDVLSRENHAFFYVDLAMALMSEQFERIVSGATARFEWLNQPNSEDRELDQHEHFGTFSFLCHNGELGYVQIGIGSAHNYQAGLDSNLFWQHRIPQCIGGTFNDQCTIKDGEYDIKIRIVGYESSRGVVSDPTVTDISDHEPLGRVVAIFVTKRDGYVPVNECFCVFSG